MTEWLAVAKSSSRAEKWEMLIGTDRVPVLHQHPRLVESGEGSFWGYDVAVGRLHVGQRNRLAAYVGRVTGADYATAHRILEDGLVIRADEVEVITVDAWGHRPFSFGRVWAWLVVLVERVLWRTVLTRR